MGKYTQKLRCCLWNINVSGWKLLGWLDDMEGKTEVLVRKQLIFDHCAFFCMSLYAPMYVTKTVHCVIQFQEPLNQVAALTALTKPLTVWKPLFRGHSQLAQANHNNSRYSSSCDSPVSAEELRNFLVSASSVRGNPSPVPYELSWGWSLLNPADRGIPRSN